MAVVGPLNFPDTPSFGDPAYSWPWYSIVGYPIRSKQHRAPIWYERFDILREDEEIIILLIAIFKGIIDAENT